MRTATAVACALIIAYAHAQVERVELDSGWRFQQLPTGRWYAAEVPGTVHTDLLHNGLIPDPYFGANVDSLQWIEDQAWSYALTFQAGSELLSREHVELVFKGLDTFTSVSLNGVILGSTNNMFRTWVFDVKDLLKPSGNELRVDLLSPVAEGKRLRAAYGAELPHDNDPSGVSPFIRKAAYQFGWDFCPRLVTSGIWRPVELRGWNGVRIDHVGSSQALSGSDAVVGVEVRLAGEAAAGTLLALDVDGQRAFVPVDPGALHVRASLLVKDARRWWPGGEGEQVLYPVRVEILEKGRTTDHWSGRLGLRTISLDQHAGAFTFVVNNKAVFCKGANLVPPHMFLPAAGDSAWVRLVKDMRTAHFNMVRVWGGGVYPPDAFFEACDTAGILVWQDLMFAAPPPADEEYLRNVQREVREQQERIEVHPCLALWCGNNELSVAWDHWGWQDRYGLHGADSARVVMTMETFFQWKLPRDLAEANDGAIPYIATSPISNWGDAAGLQQGDLHYWGVWHGDSAFSSFPRNVGRFVSEYGFQSYPDSALLARHLPADQLVLGSPMLSRLQRSYKTDRPILEAIEREFHRVPRTLGEFITLSQQAQARAYELAVEAHLAARPRCMGTLFWQLNDAWPGPSWSAIDFSGNWKPVMHAVSEAYARP